MTAPEHAAAEDFTVRLETAGPIVLPGHPFKVIQAEAELVSPRFSDGRAKNISLGPGGDVRGAADDAAAVRRLADLMGRYRAWAEGVILERAPRYAGRLERGRTSLRTREVAQGNSSKRKDDRRLHVDAFASQPTGGRRILRMFTNINPDGEARHWQLGEPFEDHARRFLPRLRTPLPGEAWLLRRLGITRSARTAYDALMLGLHDASKLDDAYQREAPRQAAAFEAGQSWTVFTDSVVHAAVRGRFMLEQTFYLPVEAMARPDAAPVRVLEGLTGRGLV